MSCMELRSKFGVWDKNLKLNSLKIVIIHMRVCELTPRVVVSKKNPGGKRKKSPPERQS